MIALMTTQTQPAVRQGPRARRPLVRAAKVVLGLAVFGALGSVIWKYAGGAVSLTKPKAPSASLRSNLPYKPRKPIDTGGFMMVAYGLDPWPANASLAEVSSKMQRIGYRFAERMDAYMRETPLSRSERIAPLLIKATFLNSEGDAEKAYNLLEEAKALVKGRDDLAAEWLYTLIFYEGVTALRRGETENCVMCRGESSCILPIAPAAYHTIPMGSRLAIKHFTEYLEKFPDDLDVRWVLNIAHMTLGEYPSKVDSRYLIPLDRYINSEFNIGKFRDIGHLVGVNRYNQAGGGIMEDFDNDGFLDIAATSLDATQPMAFYRNTGNGVFEDRTEAAGLSDQLGGMLITQCDYNNDGSKDMFISRGAWYRFPIRPSLLRNNGNGTFTDVTREAGLAESLNSISSCWGDFDNDGWIDIFMCCERQSNRLYHNKGDGTFEEVTGRAGLRSDGHPDCNGATWIDIDNDGDQDLFVTFMTNEQGRLYRNNGDGTFSDISESSGIDGPKFGFSCWAWDFDNDGWLDIYANSYDRSLGDAVKGLLGQPHNRNTSKLYHNMAGKGFKDETKEKALDMVFICMGSNYGDFDNDGYLDMYLGTGDPKFECLVPNRMLKNVGAARFADISASSGTGHLQKGHSIACGDWDRDGDVDLFVQMGGTVNGDRYHNILFQNPGQGNHSLTVRLVGTKTNRAAIGARIKAVTAGETPATVYRHVSSGSSWGANPLEQTIGLGKSKRVATLEIHWPTTGTTQVFHNLDADQVIEVTEFAKDYRKLDCRPITVPQ
jgi:hypothetical protein